MWNLHIEKNDIKKPLFSRWNIVRLPHATHVLDMTNEKKIAHICHNSG